MTAKKTALISVYNKKGIVEFATELAKLNFEIISTGGTAKTLKENKIAVKEVSEITSFPEILSGRVKTLHPKIFAGILGIPTSDKHLQEMKKFGIPHFELVVVNLYPFEETATKWRSSALLQNDIPNEVIENIDIGGVALLRAAAKNFAHVLVVSDTADYQEVIERLRHNKVDIDFRKKLASTAFQYTAYYDSLIANYFTQEALKEQVTIPLRKISQLRYGENPHQKAAIYQLASDNQQSTSLITAKQLQGKELSYNNYLDLDAAWSLVTEFENPACVIVKHTNPCGVAEGGGSLTKDTSLVEIYQNALSCDPVSAFGGVIAFNCKV
ncbi:MAG: bifunctional phosphoribosylaminoimidazolecarboxamide formyltransferase/IMP cyclohydrolase, partial [Elusimicrobiota bacterium]|nr:bifunctional phosphoribosylaminoimidazolecarboxamide formyltransferase/IMP cyclohydrolase [Elusimicrobiota bacterium]